MDLPCFDALARLLFGTTSRRRLFGALVAVPVLAVADGDEAAGRQERVITRARRAVEKAAALLHETADR